MDKETGDRVLQNQLIVSVMGGGSVGKETAEHAYQLGGLIAARGWIRLNGGRTAGVLAASAKGAGETGVKTVGVLPVRTVRRASPFIH